MKRPNYDYKGFRLSRLNEPRFSHLKLLGGWIFYFSMYFLTEKLIPFEKCHVMHIALDDVIPFNEWFVIPYTFWYVFVFGTLLFYLIKDVGRFRELQTFIIVTQVVAMAVYIIYPSRQDLRPEMFPRENFFTWVLSIIYAFDTPTGVCPSLHVAYSLGIYSVVSKDPYLSRGWKIFVLIAVLAISYATTAVKQHSAIDVLWALPLGLLAEWFVYHRPGRRKTA